MDRNLKMGPGADKTLKTETQNGQEFRKTGPKKCRPSLLGEVFEIFLMIHIENIFY